MKADHPQTICENINKFTLMFKNEELRYEYENYVAIKKARELIFQYIFMSITCLIWTIKSLFSNRSDQETQIMKGIIILTCVFFVISILLKLCLSMFRFWNIFGICSLNVIIIFLSQQSSYQQINGLMSLTVLSTFLCFALMRYNNCFILNVIAQTLTFISLQVIIKEFYLLFLSVPYLLLMYGYYKSEFFSKTSFWKEKISSTQSRIIESAVNLSLFYIRYNSKHQRLEFSRGNNRFIKKFEVTNDETMKQFLKKTKIIKDEQNHLGISYKSILQGNLISSFEKEGNKINNQALIKEQEILKKKMSLKENWSSIPKSIKESALNQSPIFEWKDSLEALIHDLISKNEEKKKQKRLLAMQISIFGIFTKLIWENINKISSFIKGINYQKEQPQSSIKKKISENSPKAKVFNNINNSNNHNYNNSINTSINKPTTSIQNESQCNPLVNKISQDNAFKQKRSSFSQQKRVQKQDINNLSSFVQNNLFVQKGKNSQQKDQILHSSSSYINIPISQIQNTIISPKNESQFVTYEGSYSIKNQNKIHQMHFNKDPQIQIDTPSSSQFQRNYFEDQKQQFNSLANKEDAEQSAFTSYKARYITNNGKKTKFIVRVIIYEMSETFVAVSIEKEEQIVKYKQIKAELAFMRSAFSQFVEESKQKSNFQLSQLKKLLPLSGKFSELISNNKKMCQQLSKGGFFQKIDAILSNQTLDNQQIARNISLPYQSNDNAILTKKESTEKQTQQSDLRKLQLQENIKSYGGDFNKNYCPKQVVGHKRGSLFQYRDCTMPSKDQNFPPIESLLQVPETPQVTPWGWQQQQYQTQSNSLLADLEENPNSHFKVESKDTMDQYSASKDNITVQISNAVIPYIYDKKAELEDNLEKSSPQKDFSEVKKSKSLDQKENQRIYQDNNSVKQNCSIGYLVPKQESQKYQVSIGDYQTKRKSKLQIEIMNLKEKDELEMIQENLLNNNPPQSDLENKKDEQMNTPRKSSKSSENNSNSSPISEKIQENPIKMLSLINKTSCYQSFDNLTSIKSKSEQNISNDLLDKKFKTTINEIFFQVYKSRNTSINFRFLIDELSGTLQKYLPKKINIISVIESLVGMFTQQAILKCINLIVDFSDIKEIKTVITDEFKLKQILFNFLLNSLENSPKSSTISVIVERNQKYNDCLKFTILNSVKRKNEVNQNDSQPSIDIHINKLPGEEDCKLSIVTMAQRASEKGKLNLGLRVAQKIVKRIGPTDTITFSRGEKEDQFSIEFSIFCDMTLIFNIADPKNISTPTMSSGIIKNRRSSNASLNFFGSFNNNMINNLSRKTSRKETIKLQNNPNIQEEDSNLKSQNLIEDSKQQLQTGEILLCKQVQSTGGSTQNQINAFSNHQSFCDEQNFYVQSQDEERRSHSISKLKYFQ